MSVLKTMLDVRNLLKRYGIFIYTRDRVGDLELMEMEVSELYHSNMIQQSEYQLAMIIIRKEKLTHLN